MYRTLSALALALIAVFAVGCKSSTSSAHVTPSESAAAHTAEQKGIVLIEGCVPNGKAMIGSVVDKTATATTYIQVFRFFRVKANRVTVWHCVTTQPGSASVPGTNMEQKVEACYVKSPAATAAVQHPFHAAHHVADTIRAQIDAAAVCVGQVA